MPGLAHYFHIMPWDVDRMWPAEIDVYMKELSAIGAEHKKAERAAKKTRRR